MPKLKRNHFIPKSMLNYWASESESYKYKGVWVYELNSRRKYFANAQGRTAYSFAARNDLYVPIIGGDRATVLEEWFSNLEGRLANFTRQVHEHQKDIVFDTLEDITLVLRSLFIFECRSPFNIQLIRKALETSPELLNSIHQSTDFPLDQLVLENIVNYAIEYATRYSKGSMVVLHSENQDMVISDRPVFDHPNGEPRFFILTNKVVIALGKELLNTNEFMYLHMPLDQEMFDLINKLIALRAREWIVTTTEGQLDQYIAIVESEEWKEYRDTERVSTETVFSKTNGWKITSGTKQELSRS